MDKRKSDKSYSAYKEPRNTFSNREAPNKNITNPKSYLESISRGKSSLD